MFDKKGLIALDATKFPDEDATLEAALEAGAEDFRREEDVYVVTTEPNSLYSVKAALEAKGITSSEAELAMVPKNTVPVTNKDEIASLFKLIDALEELDDVQKVWGNFDVADADMEALQG